MTILEMKISESWLPQQWNTIRPLILGIFVVIVLFLSSVLHAPVAGADFSPGRKLGLGILLPDSLSIRYWITDDFAWSGSLHYSFESDASDLNATSYLLLKLSKGRILDSYGVAGLRVFSYESGSIFFVAPIAAGGLGVELSPMHAVSIDLVVEVGIRMDNGLISFGPSGLVHVYF